MKNQIAFAENSVKNLDIAAFMAKDKKVMNDSHKEGDFASETMKKMESRRSSVIEILRQTSAEFLDGVRAHKKALMAVGLGAVAVGGGYLAYQLSTGRKTLSLKTLSVKKIIPQAVKTKKTKVKKVTKKLK